jgi:hypothetical protein
LPKERPFHRSSIQQHPRSHPFTIQRDNPLDKGIYTERSATERINSQAKALGIERPKLRNGQAITNINTLIYVLINLRALLRIEDKIAEIQD